MSLSPGTRLGPYEVGTLLGEGGMGEVYRARDPRLQRDVAIKVLPAAVASDSERLARFTREAQLLASLNHPHIAHVYGIEQDATTRALVMELVDGPTLADRIAGGPIPLEEALPIARQIADALDAAHERGIIHRDLKPANIKLTTDGIVKVLDFGLAKALEAGAALRSGSDGPLNSPTITTPAMTQAGMILGTAAYMSPEQARGKPVDKRADIWAFGVVIYEMLTGRQLFAGETVSDTIAEVLKREFDWSALPAATPPGIRRVVEHALQRDPRKRLRDIGDAVAELDASPVAERVVTERRTAGVSVAIAGLIALAIATSAAAAAWFLKPPTPQTARPIVRFDITIDDTWRTLARQAIAVSPDGSTLAMRAGSGILLRRRDDLNVTPVRNTDGAGVMAFSPDGRSLAFSSPGHINRVELGTGAPQTVWSSGLSGDTVAGLTWSADGTLAFAFQNSINVLRPGSSTATPLKSPGGLYVGLPHFLPDGQSLLYFKADTATPDSHVVVWHPLSGGEPVDLIKGSAPQFVPPDRLLFTRGSTLLAARLDLTARRVIGDAEVVTDRVMAGGTSTQTPHFAASRSGDLYYLDGGLAGTEGSTLMRARPNVEPAAMLDETRAFVDVRFSPDRRKLAMHLADQDDDIWVLDVARRVLNRVTFVAGEDETPAWSPDGTELAFASTRAGETERTIRIARADGSGNERVVWKYAGHAHLSDWSPDGRWLLVDMVTPDRGIQLVDLKDPQTTAKLFQETSFSQSNARVSPNGQWVAYMSNESGRNEIYVQSFPQSGNKIRISTGGGITPIWSHDGSRLFYRSQTHLMAVTVSYRPELTMSVPQPLIPDTYGRPLGDTHTAFDVTGEGEFVFTRPVAAVASIKPRVHGVLNWAQGLR